MTRSRIASRIVPMLIAAAVCALQAAQAETPIALVPKPLHVERTPGEFVLSGDTVILVDKDSSDAATVGKLLAERLRRSTGFPMAVKQYDGTAATRGAIVLTNKMEKDASALGPEGYMLVATPERVIIAAAGGPGLFYGTQTLLQLLPPQVFSPAKIEANVAWTLPAVQIEDKPRFRWRGLLLDVARHFFNKREIENFIDLMAEHKLNTLQLHLTDNEGWRIEIKRYSKLTGLSAWRTDDPFLGTKYPANKPYGGFFTHDEMREIVAYAQARYVNVVPEIEMPAHAGGALAAYPELSCTGKPAGEFCPGNDATYQFLEGVLAEVLQVFPSKYIHVGGDEASRGDWKTCAKCQARMKREGLKNDSELQSYFIRRIEWFLNAHGRTLIGWDEILEGGVAPNATVMSWRSMEGGVTAANAGHDVVMTPTTNCYFDYPQAKTGEPRGWGNVLPLKTVYALEPVPAVLPADKVIHILGAGGNMWTEVVPDYAQAQYMVYPRACALAEVTWSDAKQKNWRDFRNRLDVQLQRLKAQRVNYRRPRAEDAAEM
ncbi:MAG: beta-N-acetylhexosaminidase [Thermoguttaceae bacterium]